MPRETKRVLDRIENGNIVDSDSFVYLWISPAD